MNCKNQAIASRVSGSTTALDLVVREEGTYKDVGHPGGPGSKAADKSPFSNTRKR